MTKVEKALNSRVSSYVPPPPPPPPVEYVEDSKFYNGPKMEDSKFIYTKFSDIYILISIILPVWQVEKNWRKTGENVEDSKFFGNITPLCKDFGEFGRFWKNSESSNGEYVENMWRKYGEYVENMWRICGEYVSNLETSTAEFWRFTCGICGGY